MTRIEVVILGTVAFALVEWALIACAVASWRDTHFVGYPIFFGSMAFGIAYWPVRTVVVAVARRVPRRRPTPVVAPIDPYRIAADREVETLLSVRADASEGK